jgi:hypothetical protein
MTKSLITLALLGSLTLTLADASIDVQITAIQNAPAQERVELMNQFKQQLATMNAEDRSAAISAMQTKMQARQDENHAQRDMTRVRMQEHAGEMQMEQNGQMSQMQNMNQHQAGEQFMQQSGAITHPAAGSGAQTPPSGGSNSGMPFNH